MAAIELKIEQLILDSANPRIGSAENQRDALQKILDDQGDKLFALADSIATDGLNPIERLLVLRTRSRPPKYVVLEGNRRVATLKFLATPALLSSLEAKSALQKRFKALAATFDVANLKIPCFEVSAREEGNRWIYLRHTGENGGRGVVPWSGIASSRFRGGDPALQALDYVRSYGALDEKEKALLDGNFPITTLDRLFSTVEVRKLIGIAIKDQSLQSGLPPDELMKPLKTIILDLAEGKINVSDLKNKAAQIAYIRGLGPEARADLSKIGAVRSVGSIKGSEFTGGGGPPKKRAKPDLADRKTVVPSRMRLNITDNKTALIFKELKLLKIDDVPNAIAVLLRVFLELSVDCYCDRKSIPLKYKDPKNGKLIEKNLKVKATEVIQHLVNVEGCSRKDFESVVRSLNVDHSPFNINLLHAYVHNRFTTPKGRDLMAAWNDAHRLFEKIWA